MTLAAIIYGLGPPFADFNKTHVSNPLWPGHARFHVVWQVLITFWIAVLGSYLLWKKTTDEFFVKISFLLGMIILGGFLINSAVTHLYDGSLSDPNGYLPIFYTIDTNLFAFSIAFIFLVVGYLMFRSKAN